MYELVPNLPDGFFNRFSNVWPEIRSSKGNIIIPRISSTISLMNAFVSGRFELFLLMDQLLYDEQVSFLVTVPNCEKLRDVLSLLTIYSSFLICHDDKKYRESFDLLHRLSTLCRQFEVNLKKRLLFEYSCPRKYHYHEPFTHFGVSWPDMEEKKSSMSTSSKDSMLHNSTEEHDVNAPPRYSANISGHYDSSFDGDVKSESEMQNSVHEQFKSKIRHSNSVEIEMLRFMPKRS